MSRVDTHETSPDNPPDNSSGDVASRWALPVLWLAGFLGIAIFTLVRLQVFPLETTVQVGGMEVSLPRAYFTVDHPFHTARAEFIRSAWASLDTVRWVANHQGGYPSEFFPFGVPAIAALLAFASIGALSIEAAWSLTIAALFLLPGLAFVLLGRRDRLTPSVAMVALAGQVSIASDWMHGGFTELVEWGLATNVAGATYALLAIPLLTRAIDSHSYRSMAISAGVIALCAVSNPRSLIAVVAIAVAILVRYGVSERWRGTLLRLAVVASLSVGLAAPVIFPLLRYRELYFFLSYQEYASVGDYINATVSVLTWPVALLAAGGIVLAFILQTHRATQTVAITLLVYSTLTAMATAIPELRELIPQLELPRLMPFQRLLMLYLAAYGTVELVRRAIPMTRTLASGRDMAIALVGSLALILLFTTSVGPFPAEERGLRDVPRTEGGIGVDLIQLRDAVARADTVAPPHTAILVIGSRMHWHDELWAPLAAEDRRFYYSDWLWYWHQLHDGPYDYRSGHFYPNPSEALAEEYLETQGIGAVVITDAVDQLGGANVRAIASSVPMLESEDTFGSWDVYTVNDPVSIATLNGENASDVRKSDDYETIRMTFDESRAGTVQVRHNWFPRWSATVNGDPASVTRAENGYMEIQTGGGDVEVTLTYATTALDVVARMFAVAAGLVVLLLATIGATPIRRLVRR